MTAETRQTAPAERVAAEIADQTRRSVDQGLPVFFLVVYEHEAEKLDCLAALRRELSAAGLQSRTYDPRHRPDHGAGELYRALAQAGERTLALVADLPRGEDGLRLDRDFLAYLNLHRDRVGRQRLRLVLMLHAADYPRFVDLAGDLWDVRQQTFWLERPAGPRGEGLWLELERRLPELTVREEDKPQIAEYVARVREQIAETARTEDRAALLLDLSGWLRRRYAAKEAAQVALEGLAEAPEEAKELRAELEHAAGLALRATSDLSEALNHYEHSLELNQELGDRNHEAQTLNNMSQVYQDWSRNQEALEALQASLEIRREVGDRRGEAVTLNNIAQVYQDWSRSQEALEALTTSLEIKREMEDRRGEAIALNNIATLHHARGDNQQALEVLLATLAIDQELGDRHGEAVSLNNIAAVYHAKGRNQQALKALEASLEISRQVSDRRSEAVTLNNIAQIYQDWGRYEEALEQLRVSLGIFQEVGDVADEAVTCWNLARLFEKQNDLEQAVLLARRAVEIREHLDTRNLEKDRTDLAKLERRLEHQRLAQAGMVAEDTPEWGS